MAAPSSAGIGKVQNPQNPQPSPGRVIPCAESSVTLDTHESKPGRLWTDGDTAAKPNVLGVSSCTNAKAAPQKDTLCQDKRASALGLPSGFTNTSLFPTHAFFPLYIYSLTPVPRKRSATEQTWLQALFGLLLFGFYWKHSRRYLPEVTPRAVLHGQEGNVVNQEVHLLGNFAGSDDIGMVQPKHTESWMKTLTPLLGQWHNRLQCSHGLCSRHSLFPNCILAHSSTGYLPVSKCMKSIPWEYTNQLGDGTMSWSQGTGLWWWGHRLKFWIPAQSWQSHDMCVCVWVLLHVGTDSPWPKGFTGIPQHLCNCTRQLKVTYWGKN